MSKDGQYRIWKILIAVREFLRHELVSIIETGFVDPKEWTVVYEAVKIIGEEEVNISPDAHAICEKAIKDLEKDSNELLAVLRGAMVAQQTPDDYDNVYWVQQVNKKHQQIVGQFEQHLNDLKQQLTVSLSNDVPRSHEDADNIKRLIKKYNHALQKLREQQAGFGLHVPVHILLEIENNEAEIEKLQTQLEKIK